MFKLADEQDGVEVLGDTQTGEQMQAVGDGARQ